MSDSGKGKGKAIEQPSDHEMGLDEDSSDESGEEENVRSILL